MLHFVLTLFVAQITSSSCNKSDFLKVTCAHKSLSMRPIATSMVIRAPVRPIPALNDENQHSHYKSRKLNKEN